VEIDEYYCCLAEKRLADTKKDISIQGYSDGVFWERNTLQEQVRLYSKNNSAKKDQNLAEADLFSG